MKTIIKSIIAFALIFNVSTFFSQVTTTINNLTTVPYNIQVPNCGTIDLESYNELRIQFTVELSKLSTTTVDSGQITAYYKKSTSSQKQDIGSPYNVPANFGSTFTASLDLILQATDFNVSGGTFYVVYKPNGGDDSQSTCSYSVEKDQVPTFTISPTNTTVSCNSSSPKTFTVTNVYNSPGNLSYNWEVGNGWNSVSNFTTTTNSISLVPNSYPPSNVSVTPVLDGVSYPKLTTTVSLSNFNPNYQITGSSSICSTSNYTINNLPTGTSVSTWTSSNTNIASINSNGNQATLTAVGNGIVTVSAVVSNSCNQTKTISKTYIKVGKPTFTGTMSGESSPVVGQYKWYSVPPVTGANSYYWYFDVGNNQTGTNIDGWKIQNGQGTTGVFVKVGNTGSTVIICRATNYCGNTTSYKYVNARSQSDPCDENLKIASDGLEAGKQAGRIEIWIDDPCDNNNYWQKTNKEIVESKEVNKTITIYDSFGKAKVIKSQKGEKTNIDGLKKGLYFVKYQTKNGKIISKKFIVE